MSARARAFQRGLRAFLAILVTASIGAVAAPEFRDLIGDSPTAALFMAVVPSLLLALDKALRDWNVNRRS